MQFISLFLDIEKVADSWWQNADVCRKQGMSHKIFIFSGSCLGEQSSTIGPSISSTWKAHSG